MKHLQIILALCLMVMSLNAGHAQGVRADSVREKNFAYEVKVMDEFMERFNDDPKTLLRKYLDSKKGNLSAKFGRREMIISLFNHPEKWKDQPAAKAFLRQVLDTIHPQGMRFVDTNWFAEAICVFDADGRKTEIPLILQLWPGTSTGSKWMITGIGDSYIFHGEQSKEHVAAPSVAAPVASISPAEYATDFIALHTVLNAKMQPEAFFTPKLLQTDRCKRFVSLIHKGELSFSYTGLTRFHLYQIPGYALMVERFVRPGTNSGWLITDLQAVTPAEVVTRKSKLLQRAL